MARKPSDIQYVQFYTDGSAARQVETPAAAKRTPQRRRVKRPVVTVQINPVAIAGIALVAVMLVMMVVGLVQVGQQRSRLQQMEAYVSQLEQTNEVLQQEYQAGYDLESIEEMALALGMIPQEQAENVVLQVPRETVETQPSWWENIVSFLRQLLA